MIGVSAIDVEVAGDGSTVRGAFLDWMVSRTVAHPRRAETRDVHAGTVRGFGAAEVPDAGYGIVWNRDRESLAGSRSASARVCKRARRFNSDSKASRWWRC